MLYSSMALMALRALFVSLDSTIISVNNSNKNKPQIFYNNFLWILSFNILR
jgi:hypothetical protein